MSRNELLALVLIALVSAAMSYLGAAVGLVLGQVRVALLTYALGSAVEGAATSLAVSTVATVIGTVAHAREGRVHLGLLITIGGPSALAAYGTARFSSQVDPHLLKLAIAVTLLVTGFHMLWRVSAQTRDLTVPPPKLTSPALVVLSQVGVGAVLGAVSGLVGLLLGSLRLPAMVRLTRVAVPKAVGTNMAIGAITGLSAGMSAMAGGHVDVLAFAVVSPLTLLGSYLGARQTGKLDERALTRWIAYAIIPTALLMLAEIGLELVKRKAG